MRGGCPLRLQLNLAASPSSCGNSASHWHLGPVSSRPPSVFINPLPSSLCTFLVQVLFNVVNKGLRPPVPDAMPGPYRALMEACWSQRVEDRCCRRCGAHLVWGCTGSYDPANPPHRLLSPELQPHRLAARCWRLRGLCSSVGVLLCRRARGGAVHAQIF